MKKSYLFYYALMIFINVLPILPLSVKGILGLVFIVISCIWLSYRDAMLTAALCIALEVTYFIFE